MPYSNFLIILSLFPQTGNIWKTYYLLFSCATLFIMNLFMDLTLGHWFSHLTFLQGHCVSNGNGSLAFRLIKIMFVKAPHPVIVWASMYERVFIANADWNAFVLNLLHMEIKFFLRANGNSEKQLPSLLFNSTRRILMLLIRVQFQC